MEQFATRCPQCHTGFRVTQAQLDMRAGQVRCGVCQHGFDALAQRFEVNTAVDAASAAEVDGSSSATANPAMQAELDALSQAIADLRAKPWAEPPAAARTEDEPLGDPETDANAEGGDSAAAESPLAYDSALPQHILLPETRRRSRSRRLWLVLQWVGLPLLMLALTAQLAYYFRNDIAARSPQAARHLREICAQIGCTIRLPMHLDQLSLEGAQLDAAPTLASTTATSASDGMDNVAAATGPITHRLTLIALLRNHGNSTQAWPSIDVQLKGADGKVVVRKSFLPAQYLRADDIPAGMSARSEMEIRIPFELAGDVPAGFDATLFYH